MICLAWGYLVLKQETSRLIRPSPKPARFARNATCRRCGEPKPDNVGASVFHGEKKWHPTEVQGHGVVHLPILPIWNALLNLQIELYNSSSDKAWCLDVVNIHGLDIINVSVPSKAHQNMFRKTQPPFVLMRQWRKETRKTGSGDTWHNDNYHKPYTVYFSHANHPPLEVGCQFILFLVGPDARWDQRDSSHPAINL